MEETTPVEQLLILGNKKEDTRKEKKTARNEIGNLTTLKKQKLILVKKQLHEKNKGKK